jgi:hypothetical protein
MDDAVFDKDVKMFTHKIFNNGLKLELTSIKKSPLAPLYQRGVLFLPLVKGG